MYVCINYKDKKYRAKININVRKTNQTEVTIYRIFMAEKNQKSFADSFEQKVMILITNILKNSTFSDCRPPISSFSLAFDISRYFIHSFFFSSLMFCD